MKNRSRTVIIGKLKARGGFLLLELNLVLVILAVLGLIFSAHFGSLSKTFKSLEADVRLHQANRYTQSLLGRELSYDVESASLSIDSLSRQHLINQSVLGNVQTHFYRSDSILYRKKTSAIGSGVNPFSLIEVIIVDMQLQKLSADSLLITLILKDEKSGRIKTFSRRHRLCNGYVIQS